MGIFIESIDEEQENVLPKMMLDSKLSINYIFFDGIDICTHWRGSFSIKIDFGCGLIIPIHIYIEIDYFLKIWNL